MHLDSFAQHFNDVNDEIPAVARLGVQNAVSQMHAGDALGEVDMSNVISGTVQKNSNQDYGSPCEP